MPKVKIRADAELSTLDRDELRAELRSWMQEALRGAKFIPLYGQITKTGATFTIGDNSVDPAGLLGPADGFVWSVMSINVNGPGIAAADTFIVYDSTVSGTRVRVPNLTNAGKSFQKAEFVVTGPEKIRVTGASTGAGNEIFVSGSAIEVPTSQSWMLC